MLGCPDVDSGRLWRERYGRSRMARAAVLSMQLFIHGLVGHVNHVTFNAPSWGPCQRRHHPIRCA
jgi:hypothetical protein